MLTTTRCSPWPVDFSCVDKPDGVTPEQIEKWTLVASQILWALSGRRFGPCPVTVRPCLKKCADDFRVRLLPATGFMVPYTIGGKWYNWRGCGCTNNCSCSQLCEIRLEGPVYDIIEVTIDGAVVDPADYRVDSANMLVRQNGGCWPECQRLDLPAGEKGTFVVEYNLGLPVDPAGIVAVSTLTAEFLKACVDDGDCRLPSRWHRIVRQGVEIRTAEDDSDFMRTGIWEIDMWLETVNPAKAYQPARVYSPDLPRGRVTTW